MGNPRYCNRHSDVVWCRWKSRMIAAAAATVSARPPVRPAQTERVLFILPKTHAPSNETHENKSKRRPRDPHPTTVNVLHPLRAPRTCDLLLSSFTNSVSLASTDSEPFLSPLDAGQDPAPLSPPSGVPSALSDLFLLLSTLRAPIPTTVDSITFSVHVGPTDGAGLKLVSTGGGWR